MPSGQQPNLLAAHPQPSESGPPAGVRRSGQHPNSVSLQLQPSCKAEVYPRKVFLDHHEFMIIDRVKRLVTQPLAHKD